MFTQNCGSGYQVRPKKRNQVIIYDGGLKKRKEGEEGEEDENYDHDAFLRERGLGLMPVQLGHHSPEVERVSISQEASAP